jgi:hypothetical protein
MQVILPSPRGECDFGLTPRVYDLAHDPECRSDLASSRRELVKRAEACSASVSSQAIREQSGPVDSAQMRALQGMGYVGDVVDHVRQELAEASVEALLKTIAEPGDCFRRLEAARALEVRKLEVDERAKVREILKREISPAIRAELERVLSK